MTGKANLSFTGIPTFGRAPVLTSTTELDAEVAVLGIPYDEGVGFRPGTRFGPRAIREYSLRFPYFADSASQRGFWDIENRCWKLTDLQLVDCGDVDIVMMNRDYVYDQIQKTIREISDSKALPVVLGGDHSISYPVVRSLDNVGSFGIVQLDAHLDRRNDVAGVKFGHGSPIKRISELPFVEAIASLGLRGLRAPESDWLEAEQRGEVLIPAHTIHRIGAKSAAAQIPSMERCYVTIDIDVLDPSIAPGTGTPEADGLRYTQVREILQSVAQKSQIVGFDLVEVNPYLDPSGRTALFAAQLIVEFLGDIFG